MSFTFVQAGKQNENKFHITFSIHPDEWKAKGKHMQIVSQILQSKQWGSHTPLRVEKKY